jgi:hypothetical protein
VYRRLKSCFAEHLDDNPVKLYFVLEYPSTVSTRAADASLDDQLLKPSTYELLHGKLIQ